MTFKDRKNMMVEGSTVNLFDLVVKSNRSKCYEKFLATIQVVTDFVGLVLFFQALIFVTEAPTAAEQNAGNDYFFFKNTTENTQGFFQFSSSAEMRDKDFLKAFVMCVTCFCGVLAGIFFYYATRKFDAKRMCAYILFMNLTTIFTFVGICLDTSSHLMNMVALPITILHSYFHFLGVLYISPVYKEYAELQRKTTEIDITSPLIFLKYPKRNRAYASASDTIL